MAAGSGWTTSLAPYQFEPESEPESEPEPEKEEGPEQRHEGKTVPCDDEFMPSPDEEPCDSPAQFSSGEMSDAARQSPRSPGQRTMTKQYIQDDGEEYSTSLSVGDGHYLVDLGSSSEFIVDEECLLQQFRSCRKCSQECKIRKRLEGLKLVLTQVCFFCAHRFTWTNLSDNEDDNDDSDF
ncbi:hypothetical protein JOB18_001257 [Solea senegalensis]|uniref:Uncharacterized protein n=1 Tax=Solea senegalensis TaxID=28829 RepID=A0AAV6Q9F4_SOLSE|nr:hypothetical protein JOB18_001257 [Solea senegalensis]